MSAINGFQTLDKNLFMSLYEFMNLSYKHVQMSFTHEFTCDRAFPCLVIVSSLYYVRVKEEEGPPHYI